MLYAAAEAPQVHVVELPGSVRVRGRDSLSNVAEKFWDFASV
jgi:hypothetical protein